MASSTNMVVRHSAPDNGREPHYGSDVLEALPLPVAVLDGQGVIRMVNAAWKRLEPPDFAPGAAYCVACESSFDLGTGGLAVVESGIRNVIGGYRESFSAEFGARSGPVCTRVTVSPLASDGFVGAVVLHCQAVVTSAAPEKSEDRRQSEKMEAVGRLVGGVAHDFANLLTLISGYSEIILNRVGSNEPLRAELEEIRKAANRGSRLTSQILGFTRGQAVEPQILDLNALILDMQKMLRPIIGEHINLTTAPSMELGKVKADPGHMEQVIMNLVLNARDAMPRGGKITIQTANLEVGRAEAAEHETPPGSYVALTFMDTGQGMDAQTLSHVFEPFFTTKEKGKGTGLGLSTVYGIAKRYGGDVWVRSIPGTGTTFTILMPRTDAAPEAAEARTAQPAAVRGSETILLVEDEESVRRLLKHVLSRQGYKVLEAQDGPAALELLAAERDAVHLLLTDMVMPRMSGREVAERSMAMRPGIKVIYMSGYTDDVLMRTGALGPGMSFLQKPLRPEVLTARVRDVLDQPTAAA